MKEFKERVMEYEAENFDSISMETLDTCLREGSEDLRNVKSVRRSSLLITIFTAVVILSLAVISALNFRVGRYALSSFQIVLIIWDLFVLNKSANMYSEAKNHIHDVKEFIELMNYIKSKKVQKTTQEEQL